MFALLISKPRFKSINFYQNIPKIMLFLEKNAKYLVCWGLSPQTLCLQQLVALLPHPQPPAAEGFAPRPPKHPPIANLCLRTWWFYCCYVILCKLILQLAGVYGFPQAFFPWNKFAHPCIRPC